jgi:hypothetical protein
MPTLQLLAGLIRAKRFNSLASDSAQPQSRARVHIWFPPKNVTQAVGTVIRNDGF